MAKRLVGQNDEEELKSDKMERSGPQIIGVFTKELEINI